MLDLCGSKVIIFFSVPIHRKRFHDPLVPGSVDKVFGSEQNAPRHFRIGGRDGIRRLADLAPLRAHQTRQRQHTRREHLLM